MVFIVVGPVAALACLLTGGFRHFPLVMGGVLLTLFVFRLVVRLRSGAQDREAPL